MSSDVVMPQMGESIAEGTITKWLKQVGDSVEVDEPLYEISTDKVDAEIPSPSSGVLSEILVAEGETVEVQTVVARIDGAGEAVGPPAAPSQPAADSEPESDAKAEPQKPAAAAAPVSEAAPTPRPAAPAATSGGSREERLRTKSSPLVRKIAAENDVDISQIRGSGVQGRVTKQDILDHISGAGPVHAPVATAASSAPPAAPRPAAPTLSPGAGDYLEPMSRMRQIIAERMVESKHTAAHVHTFYEIDMSQVDRIRRANKERFLESSGGAKLTYTVFVAKAVVDALQAMPIINASISGTDVLYHGDVNLGMAVALEWGLIVPVIRRAQDLSMVGLAKAITDLATRARNKQLGGDEISGSTFSITNPGSLGSLIGTPVINQPNSAILGMGKVEKRVVVVDDMIAIRPRMFLTLGYDHRLIDGAVAEQFLSRVQNTLENFDETAI